MISMGWVSPGMIALLLVLIWTGLTGLFMILDQNQKPGLCQRVSVFDRIKQEISLAVEKGARVHLSLGRSGVNGQPGMAGLAGLVILRNALVTTFFSDKPLKTSNGDAVLDLLSVEFYSQINQDSIREFEFEVESSQLCGLTPFSFAAGARSIAQEPDISVNVFTGHFGSEIGLLLDDGEKLEHVSYLGTDNLPAQAIGYTMSENPILGEDLFAVASCLDRKPQSQVSLLVQDFFRWGIILVILAGILLRIFGVL
jgi:hypothetical protein